MISQLRTLSQLVRHSVFSRRPSYLLYLVTMRCNGRCRMCFYWRWQIDERRELTVDEVNQFSRSMGRLFQVQLGGGEPFLRDDFEEIALRIAYNCRPSIITIPTNASMPDVIVPTVENLCRKIPGTMVRMVLSIDAVGRDHDAIRGVPGIFDLAMETFRGLRALSEKYVNLTVNVVSVLSYFNVDTIEETIRYFREEVRPDQHMVMLTHGEPRDERATDVAIEDYERAVRELLRGRRDAARGYPLDRLGSVLASELYGIVRKTCTQRRQVIPCVAGRKQIMVDDEGVVYPCAILAPFLNQHPTNALNSAEMGRLRDSDYSVPDILRSPQAIAVRRFIAAGGCYCPSECFLSPSLLLNPAMYPRLALSAFRLICKRPVSE